MTGDLIEREAAIRIGHSHCPCECEPNGCLRCQNRDADLRALPAAVPPSRTTGGQGAHWEGCYKTHSDCADALIDELRAEVAALKAAARLRAALGEK